LPETNDVQDWKQALDNAEAQLEHQGNRVMNLELLAQYGSKAWQVHNFQLEGMLDVLKSELQTLKDQILGLNQERQEAQMEVAGSLQSMESKWQELVEHLIRVDLANTELQDRVDFLRQRKEQILKQQKSQS
jgi:pre-mRNA-splicing factor SPF27